MTISPVLTVGPNVGSLPPSFSLEPTEPGRLAIPVQNGFVVPTFERQERPVLPLGGAWRKLRQHCDHDLTLTDRATALRMIEGTAAGWLNPGYDDSDWQVTTLPSVENRMPAYEDPAGPEDYQDGVWYRRTVAVPSDFLAGGRRARLTFLAANYVLDAWVNGTWVGYHEGGYTPFAFDVTHLLRPGEQNLIVLRVDNPPWWERQDIVPGGGHVANGHFHGDDWWNYTGVIQDLYLESVPGVSIVRADLVPLDTAGNFRLRVVLENVTDADALVSLNLSAHTADRSSPAYLSSPRPKDIAGPAVPFSTDLPTALRIPARSHISVEGQATLPNALPWSMNDPNLYVLAVHVRSGAQSVDELWTQFGVRVVARQGASILVNGRTAFFSGVARHEEWWNTGRTADFPRIVSDLQVVRSMGARLLRTAHYPNHVDTYVIADRLGLSCWEEVPCWQFTDVQFAIQADRRIADQIWREMIFAGFNRPSILFWSTCNECREFVERGRYIQRITEDRRENYPDGRLTTQAAAANVLQEGVDPTQDLVDVAGWTLYFGIFYGKSYGQPTQDFLRAQIAHRPDQPLLDAEYGCWSGPTNALIDRQVTVAERELAVFTEDATVSETGHVVPGGFFSGCTWFAIFNWYTQVTHLQTMGLYRMDRATAKPVLETVRDAYLPYAETGNLSALPQAAPGT